MVYHIVGFLSPSMTDDAFKKACDDKLGKVATVFFHLILIALCCEAINYITGIKSSTLEAVCIIIIFTSILWIAGMAAHCSSCQNINDWIALAYKHTGLSKGMILAKYMEINHLEPIDVLLDGYELRCRNTKNGELSSLKLRKDFQHTFEIWKGKRNGNELILDLSQNKLVAYVQDPQDIKEMQDAYKDYTDSQDRAFTRTINLLKDNILVIKSIVLYTLGSCIIYWLCF